MEYFTVAAASVVVSALTLFSGFGLGTLLLPVFALFFPVELAVAATAVVHGANNVFKMAVVGRKAERTLVLRFGIPAVLAAFIGASLLGYIAGVKEIHTYSIGETTAVITPVKLVIGALMLVFALFELLPRYRDLQFSRRYLVVGGILSGFFGGLSGHHGALRAAFLAKTEESTEIFVGTNAVIGFLVDAARIATYAVMFLLAGTSLSIGAGDWPLIGTGVAAACAGVIIGRGYLDKIAMGAIRMLTGTLLLGLSLALMAGLL